MAAHDGVMTAAPVLDTEALRRLGDDLGDAEILGGFLRRFLALLEQRIERLERSLTAHDHESWMDAVLSLKTSSAQAGARALSELAARVEKAAERPPSPSWTAWCTSTGRCEGLRLLRDVAAETARQLRLFLDQLRPAGPAT